MKTGRRPPPSHQPMVAGPSTQKVDDAGPPSSAGAPAIGVKTHVPEDALDALNARAELAARGFLDANFNGVIEQGEIKPGPRALDMRALQAAAGADGVLDAGERSDLAAPPSLKKTKRKARQVIESSTEALLDLRAHWPPKTDAALAEALKNLSQTTTRLGKLDATELGLGSRVSLSMLRDALVHVAAAMSGPLGVIKGLTLPTRHALTRAALDLGVLGRVAINLGADPSSAMARTPPTLSPRIVSAQNVALARERQAAGDVAGAWRAMAAGGDRYAAEAANIVDKSGPPPTLFAQIVHAHWDRVVGPEVKANKFDDVAKNQLENYLAEVESAPAGSDFALPNTEDIERCYRRAVEAEGLPPGLAIDSVISKIDLALDDSEMAKRFGLHDVSWGSMLGLSADRVAFNSDAFADVKMEAGEEFLKTALHTLRSNPLDIKVMDGLSLMMNTVRALVAGEPPAAIERKAPPLAQVVRLNKSQLDDARALLGAGDPEGAWALLHDAGDGYAHYALTPLAERADPKSLLAQVVNAHWDRFLGQDGFDTHFYDVNVSFLDAYLKVATKNEGRLPNTQEIETAYRGAVEGAGLDPILAPDAVMSRLAEDYENTPISWAGLLGIAEERVVYRTGVFADLDIAPAKEMFKAQFHWIMQRHVHMPFSEMAGMTWQRVKSFFD